MLSDYKVFVIAIFAVSYLGIIIFTRKKSYFAGLGALGILILSIVAPESLASGGKRIDSLFFLLKSINWNVLGIFVGTLIIAEAFIESKVPALIAHFLVSKSKNVGVAILYICIMASFISAFVENVATVLIVAPIALEIADRQKISPVPFLIGIAVSSNLQGTATLIGDPPSMILAGYMKITFNQFFALNGRPGIFFAVQIGAVASFFVLYLFYRRYKNPVYESERDRITSWFPTYLIVAMIFLLAVSSIIDPNFSYLSGAISMFLGIIASIWFIRKAGIDKTELIKKMDFDTLLFLASIFVLVGGLRSAGVMEDIAAFTVNKLGSNIFIIYTVTVWGSVLISAFVDNVPYITAMIPAVVLVADRLSISPYLLVFGLLIGSCLGGNITHVGASANVVSVAILKRRGYYVGLKQFSKIGLPFTLAATLTSYVFVWFVWR